MTLLTQGQVYPASAREQGTTDGQTSRERNALRQGAVLLHSFPHTAWGGGVTARIYLPLPKAEVWTHLTDYPRWIEYCPDIVHSEVVHHGDRPSSSAYLTTKYLHQVGRKSILFLQIDVEIHLRVTEIPYEKIKFQMERGNFTDFNAGLYLQEYEQGTLLNYTVRATPSIPVPSVLIQQVIQYDLPTNLRQMRHLLCAGAPKLECPWG